jgi:subtilisin-like proprotein convertase family protein
MLKNLLSICLSMSILFQIAANATTFSYTGPRVNIPDNTTAGINLTIPVSGMGTIGDVNVQLTPTGTCNATIGNTNCPVDHSFVGDLIFKLTSPAGTTVTVINRRGENIGSLLIDDQGGFPLLSTVPSATGSILSGNFTSDNPLSAFNGQNGNGNWILNVSDNAGIDSGSIGQFSMTVLSPTAANSSISGRVTNTIGRGLSRVSITVTDANGQTLYTTTNPFGYYRITGLNSGETVILTLQSKRYSFKEPTRVLTVSDDLADIDFVAN